jgi:hypothetical protein
MLKQDLGNLHAWSDTNVSDWWLLGCAVRLDIYGKMQWRHAEVFLLFGSARFSRRKSTMSTA